MQFAKHLTAWRDLASFEQQPVSKDAWREKSGIRPATFPDLRAVLLGHGCISENADGTYTTVTEPTREMYGWVDQEKPFARSGDGHVKQAAFVIEACPIAAGNCGRKTTFRRLAR